MKIAILILASVLQVGMCFSQNQSATVITGTVVDSASMEPIHGASIRVEGTTTGTYTRSGGRFRLPLPKGATTLRVRSVGYREKVVRIDLSQTVMTITLPSSATSLTGVKVVGEITPEEIIKRAVERKEANAKRITSIVSTTYSKLKVNIDMGGLDEGNSGPENSITETFSKIYDRRSPNPKKHVRILQRRQTANVSAQDNLAVFDDFFDFTQDEITLIKTTMVTPLGKDALDEYTYTLLGKKPLGDQMVYELAFEPKARVFPGFEGTLTIVEGTYQVVAAKFSPTDETAFPFLKDLTYEQRYEKVNDTIWAPTYQNVTALAKIRIIAGLMEISADVAAQTYVTDVAINVPIDDSLLSPPISGKATSRTEAGGATVRIEKENSTVTVDAAADSTKPEFWEEHAFAEPSDEERRIYQRQDSVKREGGNNKDTTRQGSDGVRTSLWNLFTVGGVTVGVDPMLDRSSITGVIYGGTLNVSWSPIQLSVGGGFGDKDTKVGSVDLEISAIKNDDVHVKLFGTVMSSLATVQESRTIVKRLDFLHLSSLLYTDNFDFFRRDGWEAGASLKTDDVNIALSGSWTRHINMPLVETVDRVSIPAVAGDYQMLQLAGTFLEPGIIDAFMGTASPVTMRVNGLLGRETQTDVDFWSVDAAIDARIPTFTTGYMPMELDVTVHAGIQSTQTPTQGRFVTARRFPILGSRLDFTTASINAFAGTEFASVVTEHNFSDMWWRLVGLPTFSSGRGVDLIGRFAALNVTQRAQPVVPGQVFDSTPGIYMEAGFAVGRIPTFVSDLFWLRFDAMWPVGPLAPKGSFGWAITLSSPLL
ncbi:MAG: carboxypeptidase-like regulatory domain-containing protein [Ignavibacteria bacterium]|nr:carboxypeptidase-like regulatory domain-containing protein [Ignavibacteria bacterium]MBK7413029.1 carboxypeptidase-like regulatory domain-containing protein [Ignavibacteria bacterium]MBP7092518.1 carboxypeptidase-like regulatory domain-containing protein [Candidatus Kapabacteria bacterium]